MSLIGTPLKGPSPTIGHELWGRAHVGYSENFGMIEHSKIYIFVYKSSCVTSQPFVDEMPVFLQTLYSRFLAQIFYSTMLLPA